jgi:hypothetical protein
VSGRGTVSFQESNLWQCVLNPRGLVQPLDASTKTTMPHLDNLARLNS